jgi:hypothetical protein
VPPESHEPHGYRPPPYQLATWLVLGGALVLVVGLTALRSDYNPDTSRDYPSRPMLPDAVPVLLPPPEVNDDYLPCSDCHEGEVANLTPREFEDDHVEMDFAHGDLWCMSCHDAQDHESLHLADGTTVAFEESWRLCVQCHGKKLPDWRAGVHGKRTGHWRGEKEYRPCVVCHNPHRPPFVPLEPEPPPHRPTEIVFAPPGADEVPREAH